VAGYQPALRGRLRFGATRSGLFLDNLTHSLTGFALSRAGFDRFTKSATAILILAANVPDIDIVTRAWGSLAYLNYHRHLTHAIAAMPLGRLFPTGKLTISSGI
jgi:hypothetical protein